MMRFGWLTDPWENVDHATDTSLRLAQEALTLGHECYLADYYQVSCGDGKAFVPAKRIQSIRSGRTVDDFEFEAEARLDLETCNLLMLRADPPITLGFINILQAIDAFVSCRSNVVQTVNSPRTLLTLNSKIASGLISRNRARALITADRDQALNFGITTKRTVLKPLNSCRSIGIQMLMWESKKDQEESLALFDLACAKSQGPVAIQEHCGSPQECEIRQWFVHGALIGAARKVVPEGKVIFDLQAGGALAPCDTSTVPETLNLSIRKFLQSRGIAIAAVDSIGEGVIDVNITSPGLLVEMEEALSCNLARPLIDILTSTYGITLGKSGAA